MESYLSNGTQYVEIDESNSDMLHLSTGVPQESILGPLLFIIYISDISNASKMFDFIIYADDTTLYYGRNNYQKLIMFEKQYT